MTLDAVQADYSSKHPYHATLLSSSAAVKKFGPKVVDFRGDLAVGDDLSGLRAGWRNHSIRANYF